MENPYPDEVESELPDKVTERNFERMIEDKILYVLGLFPTVSPSMLQISLGANIKIQQWHPVLERMIAEEQVYRWQKLTTLPTGRPTTTTFISADKRPEESIK